MAPWEGLIPLPADHRSGYDVTFTLDPPEPFARSFCGEGRGAVNSPAWLATLSLPRPFRGVLRAVRDRFFAFGALLLVGSGQIPQPVAAVEKLPGWDVLNVS